MNYKQSSYDPSSEKDDNQALESASTDNRFDYVHYCYSAKAVREIDYLMVDQGYVDTSYELMNRAAQSMLDFISRSYSHIHHITIVCGAGNNAGDGYVLARLASQEDNEAHLKVHLVSIIDPEKLSGDAHHACQGWLESGGTIHSLEETHFTATDLIVDALIGTGLNRALEDEWHDAATMINNSSKPVISVDIPSGLSADTGSTHGVAVRATHTITFIAQKMGMYTAKARHYCGEMHFASLGVADSLYTDIKHSATLMEWNEIARQLPCRSPTSHKGDNGHLLIIGGDYGMSGACRIAGEAALRAGAGLVSIATRKDNINAVNSARPELMVHGVETAQDLEPLLKKATAIAIGPGLGTQQWGMALLDRVIKLLKHQSENNVKQVTCVIDADALNIMARHNFVIHDPEIIYTPHFGEASRLLHHSTEFPSVESDRFQMIRALKQKYHGIFILKGAGTLVNLDDNISICPYGNEGMASAGMGDCLTGIIGALLAQKLPTSYAAQLGVCLHAKAGDLASLDGKKGMIVSDLLPKIRQLTND